MNEKLCVKGCRFFTERTISLEQTFKERYIFTEQTMFLNKHLKKLTFLPKKNFTERPFSEKTNEIDGKWKIIWRTNEIN